MSEPYQPMAGERLRMGNQSEAEFNRTVLLEMNVEILVHLTPAIIYLVILMLVGSVGNFLVIYIIGWKLKASAQNSLFMWLGVFDIVTCLIGMPSEIVDLSKYYLYENVAACKVMRFLLTFTAIGSANILVIIAVDRYRRVCRPLHSQMEVCHVRVGVALAALVALVVAGPALSLYGSRTVATPLPGLQGHDCSVQDKYRGRLYPLLYEVVFGVAFLGYTVLLAVLYVRVGMEIRRHRRYMALHSIPPAATSSEQFRSTEESEEELEDNKRKSRGLGVRDEVVAWRRRWLPCCGKKENGACPVEEQKAELRGCSAELCGSGPERPCLKNPSQAVGGAALQGSGEEDHSCSSSGKDTGGSGSDLLAEVIPMLRCSPSMTSHGAGGSENLGQLSRHVSNSSLDIGGRRTTEVVDDCVPDRRKLHPNSEGNCKTNISEEGSSAWQAGIPVQQQNHAGNFTVEGKVVIELAEILPDSDPAEEEERLLFQPPGQKSDDPVLRTTADNENGEEDPERTASGDVKRGPSSQQYLTPLSQTTAATSSFTSSTSSIAAADVGGAWEKKPPSSRLVASSVDLSKIRKSQRANKLTVVAVAVTVVFVVSYLPHLCLVTLRSVEGALDDHRLSGAELVFYNIFMRSFFINSVANVFVYSAVNPKFRRYCRGLCPSLRKFCWCWCCPDSCCCCGGVGRDDAGGVGSA